MNGQAGGIELRVLGTFDLRTSGGAPVQSVIAQPKRAALFLYLRLARPHGLHQRETLTGLFWADMDGERARKALRQALYYLRLSLGEDVLEAVGDTEVGVAPDLVWCDAVQMERAFEEGRYEEAFALYGGELLPGFYVDDAIGFERWLEEERTRLRRRAAEAAWRVAAHYEVAADAPATAEWAHKAAALSPDDETVVRRLMEVLVRQGDRAAALRAYDAFTRRLVQEYELEPSAETRALADEIRSVNRAPAHEANRAERAVVDAGPQPQAAFEAEAPAQDGSARATSGPRRPGRGLADRIRAHFGRSRIAAGTALGILAVAGYVWLGQTVLAGPDAALDDLLPDRPLLLIADVANGTAEPGLGEAITTLLSVDLAQSPMVRTMDAAAINDALARMERDPSDGLDPVSALELAKREGAAAVVVAEVFSVGNAFAIVATVLDPDGRRLLSHRVTGESRAHIIQAVDSTSSLLRRSIGEPLRSIRASDPLPRVTTASLDALKLFAEAERSYNAGNTNRATALMEEAIAVDSGFAIAYRRLGAWYANALRPEAQRMVARAYELHERLPERDRGGMVAAYRDRILHDRPGAIRALESHVARFPDENGAFDYLADLLMREKRWAEAERAADSAATLAPDDFIAHHNLFYAQMAQGKHAEARLTIERLRKNRPDDVLTYYSLSGHVGELTRDFDLARTYFDSIVVRFPDVNLDVIEHLASFDEIEGRLATASQHWEELYRRAVTAGDLYYIYESVVALALIDLRYRSDPTSAIRRIDDALGLHPFDALPPDEQPLEDLAALFAEAGMLDRADQLLSMLPGTGSGEVDTDHASHGTAAVAFHRKQFTRAVNELVKLENLGTQAECPSPWAFPLARAHAQAGDTAQALRAYDEGIAAIGCIQRDRQLATALIERGATHEHRGDAEAALRSYRQFLDLWKDADPELQPLLEDVRQRVKRLSVAGATPPPEPAT